MSTVFAQFHFLRPLWLLGLLALPALLWLWRRQRDADEPWRAACDAHLLPHLLRAGGASRECWPQTLLVLGFALALLALAGPAFRQLPQALSRAESALVVAIDLSDRMRATDLKPDRLSRAKYKLAGLLRERREGQTALLAYAGDAFVVAPLTDDAGSLSDLLSSLTADTLPVAGRRADRAIARAQRLVQDAGFARGDLLLVTDGVEARDTRAAEAAAEAGLRVSVLGVGTEAGAPAPLPSGGFVQDESGKMLLPRLDEPALRDLAASAGGRYVRMGNDRSDLMQLNLSAAVPDDAALRADERTRAEYRDEGPWLLLLLLPLAALAFRRGWLACLPLMFALQPSPAQAFEWASLWQRQDQRAYDALQNQDATRALELAQDPALRGSAAFRAEDFAQAESEFARAGDADAHYNRGNALAKAQRYEEAIEAYDAALAQAADMEDALANRKAVEDWLKQQQEQQQSQQGEKQPQPSSEQQQPQPNDDASEESQESQQSQSQEQSEQARSGQDSQASDEPTNEQEQAQASDQFSQQMEEALKQGQPEAGEPTGEPVDPREAEKQQAVEQWLRRVPDDPGGLLRRKFALEYQRRRREGDAE